VYADAILLGVKRFEYRRKIFHHPVVTAYIYSSSPVQKIVGEFCIESIVENDPQSVWAKTKRWGGVDKKLFDAYFQGCKVAYALQVGSVKMYNQAQSLLGMFGINRPPQSFCYAPSQPTRDLS
jgi:predicted transcriptional regulator